MSIPLSHYQAALGSLEEVSLIHHHLPIGAPSDSPLPSTTKRNLRTQRTFVTTSCEISLFLDICIIAPLQNVTKSGCLLLVGIEIDNQGKPQRVDLILWMGIEILLQMLMVRIVLATICCRFGSWGLVIKLNFWSDFQHKVWWKWSWSSGKILNL